MKTTSIVIALTLIVATFVHQSDARSWFENFDLNNEDQKAALLEELLEAVDRANDELAKSNNSTSDAFNNMDIFNSDDGTENAMNLEYPQMNSINEDYDGAADYNFDPTKDTDYNLGRPNDLNGEKYVDLEKGELNPNDEPTEEQLAQLHRFQDSTGFVNGASEGTSSSSISSGSLSFPDEQFQMKNGTMSAIDDDDDDDDDDYDDDDDDDDDDLSSQTSIQSLIRMIMSLLESGSLKLDDGSSQPNDGSPQSLDGSPQPDAKSLQPLDGSLQPTTTNESLQPPVDEKVETFN